MKIDEPNVITMTLEEKDLTILKDTAILLEELAGFMGDNGFTTVAQRVGSQDINPFDLTELRYIINSLYSLVGTPPNVILQGD